jgi:FkbH-like protein
MTRLRKCVVWDLDNTIWRGVALEEAVVARPEVLATIKELDRRGILHSIASRGADTQTKAILNKLRLTQYFLCPRINWLPKTTNIRAIAEDLHLSLDALAFVDDDPFEREQVAAMLPEVLTICAEDAANLQNFAEFCPLHVTRESRQRRRTYLAEFARRDSERQFTSREAFLESCKMTLTTRRMGRGDVHRVAEIMIRTHQLNSTALVLSADELEAYLHARTTCDEMYVGDLSDRFGDYGLVAIALVERRALWWRLKFFALSCRVMGRGVERAFVCALIHRTAEPGAVIEAALRDTQNNRLIRTMYQMIGFTFDRETPEGDGIFRANLPQIANGPSWVCLQHT